MQGKILSTLPFCACLYEFSFDDLTLRLRLTNSVNLKRYSAYRFYQTKSVTSQKVNVVIRNIREEEG